MAENPVGILLRVLAGVGLMQGPLGHQVLGQLLILNSSEAAIAGASVVVAATNRQRNAMGQVAIRTAAPAIAASAIINRDLRRLEQREKDIADRERLTDEAAETRQVIRLLRLEHVRLQQECQTHVAEVESGRIANHKLRLENQALRRR